jgi:cytochrome c-type biogenesis protein CcmH
MSSTLIGWILIAASIPIWLLFVVPLLMRRPQSAPFDLEVWLRSSISSTPDAARGTAQPWILAAIAFVIVSGIGAATSHMRAVGAASEIETGDMDTDEQALARLDGYVRATGITRPAPPAADSKALPDVDIMIERLAARLASAPDDVQGWRMLGWSYFNTGHFQKSAAAYAKAAALEPGSAEIKLAYETAKQKASEAASLTDAASSPSEQLARGDSSAGTTVGGAPSAAHETNASVRSMVDRLADRLAASPRDLDGWVRLMRSRVVLGEADVATTALRRALDVFKDDSSASSTITAAATELGLALNN